MRAGAYLAYLGIASLLVLLCVEGALRLAGRPVGLFDFRAEDGRTLYRPNAAFRMAWAPIPYTLRTNSLGLRGEEIAVVKPAGAARIVALGDSITEGFYVDNEAAYPYRLQALLRARGHACEVATVAEGDSSIDRQIEMYRRFAAPLSPDIVVLGTTPNDIDKLRGKTLDAVMRLDTPPRDPVGRSEWLIFGRSALGELLLDASLRVTVPKYRLARAPDTGAGRYAIADWDDVAANLAAFDTVARRTGGVIRDDRIEGWEAAAIAVYAEALAAFHAQLAASGVTLVLAYFPDYPEVYDPARRFPLPGMLAEACARAGIPFVDCTPALEAAAQATPPRAVYLAPVDFHPSPHGNEVIARHIADAVAPMLPARP